MMRCCLTIRRTISGIGLTCALIGVPAASTAAESPGVRSPDRRPTHVTDGHFWTGIMIDTGVVLSSPVRWCRSDWLKATAVGFVGLGAFAADDSLRTVAQDYRGSLSNRIADGAEPFGNGSRLIPLLGASYLAGEAISAPRLRRASLTAIESVLIAGGVAGGVKQVSHRHRPYLDDGPYRFDGPSFGGPTSTRSFPSGHAAAAFAAATAFAAEYHESWIVPPLSYGVAGLTAYSRLNDDKHWLSDLIIGAALGFSIGKTVMRPRIATRPLPPASDVLPSSPSRETD